jgi:hypothetical protein
MRQLLRPMAAPALATALALAAAACADEAAAPIVDGGPAATGEPGTPAGDGLVSGDGWRGVLLEADLGWLELPDGTLVEDVDSFRPTEEDVRRFEERLPAALATATNASDEAVTADDLGGYVRQYTGVEGGGARQLVVAALCRPDDFPEWQTSWIEVSDGGACFWDATMDLETGEILRLYVHGEA